MEEFKTGEVVKLKSGGPDMTIEWIKNSIGGDRKPVSANCVWFEDKEVKRGEFRLDNLVKV